MGRPLHVLILEDSEEDTQLLLLELRRIGYEVEFERVDTADAMQAVLTEKTWDVILSDYTMPRFSALHALEVLKASHLDLPFIIISGTIGEETAVAALKAGAHDFLIKGNFARLGSVIERELLEAETRRDRKRAEEALQTSEELFGAAFQHSPVGICITTLDGRLQNVSQSLADMLGFTTTELEGKRFNDITHPDDLEIGRDAVSRMISGRVPSVSFEKRYLHKTGEPVWALVSSSLLRDSSGQPVHLITHILNMTERKQAEAAVLEAEARYHRVLDAMMEGCQIIDFDWRYVYVNDVVANQGKHKPEELLNHTMMEIYPGIENTDLFASLRQCMEERTPKRMENQFVFPDGSIGWFELSIQPAREGIFILSTEITERKRAAEALTASEAHYRMLFESNPHPMWVYDLETLRFLAINDAAMEHYGYSHDEFLSMTIKEIRPVEDVPALMANLGGVQQDFNTPTTWRHKKKDGAVINVEISSHVIEWNERPARLVLANDITERKRAADQLNYHARLLRHINDAVIATDDQLRITAWNRAAEKMYGWSSNEVMGRNLSEILSFGLNEEQRTEARELLQESSASRSKGIHQRKDGRTIYVEANTIALIDEHGKMTGYVSVNRDITERKRAEEQTQLQLQRLKSLRAIDIAISSSFNLSLTLDILLDQVISQLNTDAAAVLLLDPITKTLEYAASRGFLSRAIRKARVRLGEGFAGRAILERRTMHIPNLMETGGEFTRAPLIIGEGFVDYYCVPLIVKGEVKGVLEIFHRSVLAGSPEWLDFLETLAGQAAIAIDNATLFEDLQHSNRELFQAYDATIEGWSRALDLRDKETEGHTQRVTELTVDLARKFGFTEEQLITIRWGALLHDIGKMGVPDHILLKPAELTEEEWMRMKSHPEYAYDLLKPITFLASSLDIPYCHHEKWDGTGYPRGLKGEEIPLAARLFAVVDVWDALRSDRPYRPAWTKDKTLEHIKSLSGTHLAPKVVEYFLQVIK